MICRKEILVNTYTALTTNGKFSTHAQRIQGDFALNQFVVHLALVTRSIAGPGNQANQNTGLRDLRDRCDDNIKMKLNDEHAYALS